MFDHHFQSLSYNITLQTLNNSQNDAEGSLAALIKHLPHLSLQELCISFPVLDRSGRASNS